MKQMQGVIVSKAKVKGKKFSLKTAKLKKQRYILRLRRKGIER